MAITDTKATANSSVEFRTYWRTRWLKWSFPALLVMVGVVGAIYDSRALARHSWWINVHAWFVLLLLGWVLARFYWHVKCLPAVRRSDMRELVRHLSRSVYLLLYVMVFAREILSFVGATWHDRSFNFDLLRSHIGLSIDKAVAGFGSDLRGYLACGFLALVLIRALAALYSRVIKASMPGPIQPAAHVVNVLFP